MQQPEKKPLPNYLTQRTEWLAALRQAVTDEEITALVMQMPAPPPGSPAHRDSWLELQGRSTTEK